MKKFLSGICATALAMSFAAAPLASAQAAPVFIPKAQSAASPSDVINVQSRSEEWRIRKLNRMHSSRHWDRSDRRDWRRSHWRGGDSRYWRGHRGYRDYRPGYRRHGDFWFPAAAFITGAIVGGALNQPAPRRVYRSGDAHVQWCYNRYRSYRAYDNTFQPYNGPRRQCHSPYG